MSKVNRNQELLKNHQYNELISENINLVHNAIKKHYPYVNPGSYEYEDMLSDGLYGMYKAAINFNIDSGYAFSTFAIKCILNQINMSYRHSKKHKNLISLYTFVQNVNGESDNDGIFLLDCIEDTNDTYFPIKQNLFVAAVKDSFLELPEKEQKIFILRYIQNLKQKEISAELGMSQRNISKILQKINLKLKYSLLQKGIDEFFFDY